MEVFNQGFSGAARKKLVEPTRDMVLNVMTRLPEDMTPHADAKSFASFISEVICESTAYSACSGMFDDAERARLSMLLRESSARVDAEVASILKRVEERRAEEEAIREDVKAKKRAAEAEKAAAARIKRQEEIRVNALKEKLKEVCSEEMDAPFVKACVNA